jgi:hypothetical protein
MEFVLDFFSIPERKVHKIIAAMLCELCGDLVLAGSWMNPK